MIAPQRSEAARPRVALCPLGGSVQPELAVLLDRRGIASNIATLSDARRMDVGAIAAVARSRVTKSMSAELAPMCAQAATSGRPVVILATPSCFANARERALLVAFLENAGAIVCFDPDVWLETVVLIAAFGLPRGPRTALVFPSGGWLDDVAAALARDRVSSRLAAVSLSADASARELEPTDILLCDASEIPPRSSRVEGLVVAPLCPRGELVSDGSPPTLVGLRAALSAARAAGELSQRIALGLGDPSEREAAVAIDFERIDKQLAKVGTRAGDHQTKVMLSAASVPIVRQAVADTASAAARLAKRAGFPAQMKPFGNAVPDELSGCPLEVDIATAADARRAFAALIGRNDQSVIVRETPAPGREISVEIAYDKSLGAMMTVRIAGQREPLAAVSPLSVLDAERLSRSVAATRVDDPDPAVAKVAELLLHASFLHRDVERIETLALPRVVAGETAAVVVDAWAKLRR